MAAQFQKRVQFTAFSICAGFSPASPLFPDQIVCARIAVRVPGNAALNYFLTRPRYDLCSFKNPVFKNGFHVDNCPNGGILVGEAECGHCKLFLD